MFKSKRNKSIKFLFHLGVFILIFNISLINVFVIAPFALADDTEAKIQQLEKVDNSITEVKEVKEKLEPNHTGNTANNHVSSSVGSRLDDPSGISKYGPRCGDNEINQDWEQCDGGENCTEMCLIEDQSELTEDDVLCNDLVLAKITIDEVRNFSNDADMTSDIYLGSDNNVLLAGTWFPLYWNGSYYIDPDLAAYEDVPGLAVQRLEDSLRIVIHGTQLPQDKEHVHGHVDFYNAVTTELLSDESNDYPGNNRLENGFDGTGVGYYNPGNDEVWVMPGTNNQNSYF